MRGSRKHGERIALRGGRIELARGHPEGASVARLLRFRWPNSIGSAGLAPVLQLAERAGMDEQLGVGQRDPRAPRVQEAGCRVRALRGVVLGHAADGCGVAMCAPAIAAFRPRKGSAAAVMAWAYVSSSWAPEPGLHDIMSIIGGGDVPVVRGALHASHRAHTRRITRPRPCNAESSSAQPGRRDR